MYLFRRFQSITRGTFIVVYNMRKIRNCKEDNICASNYEKCLAFIFSFEIFKVLQNKQF